MAKTIDGDMVQRLKTSDPDRKRHINADALRHRVLYFADARNLNGNHEQAKAYNHCLCMIDEQKTADVVPTAFHDKCMQIEIEKRRMSKPIHEHASIISIQTKNAN